jgi:hypothetical protein
MPPLAAIRWLWGAWFISWLITALWSSRIQARPKMNSEILYRVVTVAGVAALFDSTHVMRLGRKLRHTPEAVGGGLGL